MNNTNTWGANYESPNNNLQAKTVERLPFTVSVVKDEEALRRAVKIRQSAYGRHVPELASQLGSPESYDYEPGTVVILAESKLDRTPLGTMRIQTNAYKPLSLEDSVELPKSLQNKTLAEATRLGISNGRMGRVIKSAMFKAFYEYCSESMIDWMVITARRPLDRLYSSLLFKDVYPETGYIPMAHVGNIPHRVMSLKVQSVEPSWHEADHSLYDFFFRTYHPDITVAEDASPEAPTHIATPSPDYRAHQQA